MKKNLTMIKFSRATSCGHPSLLGVTLAALVFYLCIGVQALSSSSRSSTSAATASPQFTSCASPRFDDFSEKLIGDWKWQRGPDENSISMESVQEVMRSCGGAVQGIRELPSLLMGSKDDNDEDDKEGYYLNRANDGFLYFDKDGSYSCGPVKISPDDSNDHSLWISSLSFGKSRIILVKENDNDATCLQVFRKSVDQLVSTPDVGLTNNLPTNIVWNDIIRCRMPSPSQPWMLQRLKWERSMSSQGSNKGEPLNEPSVIQGWMLQMPGTDAPAFIADTMEDLDGSFLWCAGGICSQSGAAKSILRQYSITDGSLRSVALCHGQSQDYSE